MGDVDMTPFEDAFKEADADGDGKISSADLKKSLEKSGSKVSDEDIDAIMSVADQDGSGSISYEEFCQAIMGVQFMKMRLAMALQHMFMALDTDGSGFITKDNLETICEKAGVTGKAGTDKVNDVMKACDKEGNGKISFEEFVVGVLEHITAE